MEETVIGLYQPRVRLTLTVSPGALFCSGHVLIPCCLIQTYIGLFEWSLKLHTRCFKVRFVMKMMLGEVAD